MPGGYVCASTISISTQTPGIKPIEDSTEQYNNIMTNIKAPFQLPEKLIYMRNLTILVRINLRCHSHSAYMHPCVLLVNHNSSCFNMHRGSSAEQMIILIISSGNGFSQLSLEARVPTEEQIDRMMEDSNCLTNHEPEHAGDQDTDPRLFSRPEGSPTWSTLTPALSPLRPIYAD